MQENETSPSLSQVNTEMENRWNRISKSLETKAKVFVPITILNLIVHYNTSCIYHQNMENFVRFGCRYSNERIYHHKGCCCGYNRVIPMGGWISINSTFKGIIDIPKPRRKLHPGRRRY